jgi:hypothetical protein
MIYAVLLLKRLAKVPINIAQAFGDIMITKKEESSRLSLRRSFLIWTIGIFLGWGAAFVLAYNLIKSSVANGNAGEQIVAKAPPQNPEDIEPAAGTPHPKPK